VHIESHCFTFGLCFWKSQLKLCRKGQNRTTELLGWDFKEPTNGQQVEHEFWSRGRVLQITGH